MCYMINDLCKVVNRRQPNWIHAVHRPTMTYFASYQTWTAKHHDGYILDLLVILRLAERSIRPIYHLALLILKLETVKYTMINERLP